jgi:hypothetical protein
MSAESLQSVPDAVIGAQLFDQRRKVVPSSRVRSEHEGEVGHDRVLCFEEVSMRQNLDMPGVPGSLECGQDLLNFGELVVRDLVGLVVPPQPLGYGNACVPGEVSEEPKREASSPWLAFQ